MNIQKKQIFYDLNHLKKYGEIGHFEDLNMIMLFDSRSYLVVNYNIVNFEHSENPLIFKILIQFFYEFGESENNDLQQIFDELNEIVKEKILDLYLHQHEKTGELYYEFDKKQIFSLINDCEPILKKYKLWTKKTKRYLLYLFSSFLLKLKVIALQEWSRMFSENIKNLDKITVPQYIFQEDNNKLFHSVS